MLGYLILAFTLIPAVELYLLLKAGSAIGAANTILVILVTGVAGASLAKSQGKSIIQDMQQSMSQGALPAQAILHGFLVFAGGLLLLTPGFLTDIFGFLMVLPGSRHLFVLKLKASLMKRILSGQIRFYGAAASSQQPHPNGTSLEQDIIDVEYRDVTEDNSTNDK